MVPIHLSDTDGEGDKEHPTGRGVKLGEKNRDEQPGKVQIRRQENKG